MHITLALLCLLPLVQSADDKLIFVQAVWRHGDRSPTMTFPSDPNQESAWPQGWGQLTPRGMAQHVTLGKRLRQRYITDLQFVSDDYKNHEIHIRSTDVNRTLVSAISNMIGFYGASAKAGIDFPANNPDWPGNYIPIAVHTVANREDHVANADAYCPRQKAIFELWKETPEYLKAMNESGDFLNQLSQYTGINVTFDNVWMVADALFIENVWKEDFNLTFPPSWATQETVSKVRNLTFLIDDWLYGMQMAPYKGFDFSVELPKIRGGALLWSMIGHMRDKAKCYEEGVASE